MTYGNSSNNPPDPLGNVSGTSKEALVPGTRVTSLSILHDVSTKYTSKHKLYTEKITTNSMFELSHTVLTKLVSQPDLIPSNPPANRLPVLTRRCLAYRLESEILPQFRRAIRLPSAVSYLGNLDLSIVGRCCDLWPTEYVLLSYWVTRSRVVYKLVMLPLLP